MSSGHIPAQERHLMAADERARLAREERIAERARSAVAEERVAALAAHEETVMARERARESRRICALIQLPLVEGDFKGCVI